MSNTTVRNIIVLEDYIIKLRRKKCGKGETATLRFTGLLQVFGTVNMETGDESFS